MKKTRYRLSSPNQPADTPNVPGPSNSGRDVRQGGPEELMVEGRGGTLPLKRSEMPHYLDEDPASGSPRRRRD